MFSRSSRFFSASGTTPTSADVKTARRRLQNLARRLDADHPSAAASVREGLDETLTVIELGLSDRLQRSLATTNAIENLLSRTRARRSAGDRRIVGDGSVVVNPAAAEFQQRTGHPHVQSL